MILTYKYRLYPTNAQNKALDFLLWQGRTLYNAALEQRITVYRERGESVRYPEQWAHFRDLRHVQPDTLGKLNVTCIQQMLRRLDKAFTAFFRRLKHGETPGFPRFKGCGRFHSLEFKHGDGCKLRLGERVLFYLMNVGEIKVKFHRPLPEGAQIQHVILKRTNRQWYVCLQLELPDRVLFAHTGVAVGLDVGLLALFALSNGQTVENPRWLRHGLAQLRIAQRRLSRRRKGSVRRRKAARLVATFHERVRNQRRDFWHKLTRQLADTYSPIAIEDLSLAFMTHNANLSLSTHDAALGEFRQLLSYKAEKAGSKVIAVNPRNTSQRCSGCGSFVPKELHVRTHVCPHCGLRLDRDVNAARNILSLALKSARTEPSGANVQETTLPRSLRSPVINDGE